MRGIILYFFSCFHFYLMFSNVKRESMILTLGSFFESQLNMLLERAVVHLQHWCYHYLWMQACAWKEACSQGPRVLFPDSTPQHDTLISWWHLEPYPSVTIDMATLKPWLPWTFTYSRLWSAAGLSFTSDLPNTDAFHHAIFNNQTTLVKATKNLIPRSAYCSDICTSTFHELPSDSSTQNCFVGTSFGHTECWKRPVRRS